MPPQLPAGEHGPRTRWALAGLALCMLLCSLGTSIANVGLPTLAAAFDATFQQVQWIVIAYLLVITAAVVGIGRIGDLAGRRRLLLGGIALFTGASMLCAAAPTLGWLIAARAAQGLGAAAMMALTTALVGDAVSKARTGSAIGLLGSVSAVGTALGPSLGGALIAGFGWPAIFLVNLPLGIVALFLVHRFVPLDVAAASTDRAPFDHSGVLLLTLSLAAYAFAMTPGRGSFGPLNLALLTAAALGAALFVRVESKAAAPLIRLGMFGNPALGSGFAASALVTTVVMATLVVGPFYLSGALGLDPVRTGLAMSSGPVVAAVTGVPAGRAVDSLGSYRVSLAGLSAMLCGCLLFQLLPVEFGVLGYIAPLLAITAGYAFFQAANSTAVMTGIEANQRGVISGVLNLSRNLGLITGASVMGAVFAVGSSDIGPMTSHADSVSAGMRFTLAVSSGLIALALAIAMATRPRSAPIA